MKKLIKAGLLTMVLLMLGACSEEAVPTESGIHGMISRIEYSGNTAYILGSMHAGQADWFPLNIVVEDAKRRADVFVFEYDLSIDHASAEMAALTQQHMFLPYGLTLEQILPSDVHASFVENIATYNWINYDIASTMQPLMISMIAEYEILADMGILSDYSIDHYILRFAQEHNLPVLGLNSVEDETSLISAMPLDVKIAFMAQFTDKAAAIESGESQRLSDAYRANDIEAIREMFASDFADEGDIVTDFMKETVFHRRCVIFADEIERLLREAEEPTTFFITVGLGHIIGGEGGKVLCILRDRGFDVAALYN